MDADRFEDVLRHFCEARSRRGVVRALAGIGIVGGLCSLQGMTDAEAKKKRKKKKKKCKKCSPCKTCKKGKCTGTNKPDLSDCGDGKQCSGGVCATPPNCVQIGPCISNDTCCSGFCIPTGQPLGTCQIQSDPGEPCLFPGYCIDSTCVGFVCTA